MLEPAVSLNKKSPEAFRTISEVSVELEVPQHVLRFWESRFAQVKPVKRGGGRRYYRPEDVDLLRGIRALLYAEGFTIKGVQKVLREHGVRYVAEIGRGEASIGPSDVSPDNSFRDAAFEPPAYKEPAEILRLVPRESSPVLSEESRVKLEILLAELLRMKARLREALAKHA